MAATVPNIDTKPTQAGVRVRACVCVCVCVCVCARARARGTWGVGGDPGGPVDEGENRPLCPLDLGLTFIGVLHHVMFNITFAIILLPVRARLCVCVRARTHKHVCKYTYTNAHARTRTRKHTRARARAHTHTHTHTWSVIRLPALPMPATDMARPKKHCVRTNVCV